MAIVIDKPVETNERYKTFLRLFSVLMSLNLSEREIDILDRFCLHEDSQITKESRKRVSAFLSITDYNLNNYLGIMRKKNLIKKNSLDDRIVISILPSDKTLCLMFNLS